MVVRADAAGTLFGASRRGGRAEAVLFEAFLRQESSVESKMEKDRCLTLQRALFFVSVPPLRAIARAAACASA